MISFFVAGVPVPKGSAKAFLHSKTNKVVVRQDNVEAQKPWASMIGYAAQQHFESKLVGPVSIHLTFIMPRLKSHYGTGKNATTLKESAPAYHTTKPDLDKLIRCVKDALTNIAWGDDSQVARVAAEKGYGDSPGVFVNIKSLTGVQQ